MQEAFEKLKGVDIFSLKSYMEPTGFGSFNGAWVLINELFVNFFFFILNAVVGFFSLLIRILENIDLYNAYKNYVFTGANAIWTGFVGTANGSVSDQSLVGMALLALAFYLFYQYFFSKGSFSRSLLHVCLVILIGFGYFGTISGTSGGLYLLDTINNISKNITTKISNIQVNYDKENTIKIGESLSDSYIAETSYKAYLFVNTGQENGYYVNSQNGKEEPFDDSKVLGTSNSNGSFNTVKNKDRLKYLDELGNGANNDSEKNRWVSAMPDFIFIRMFYVLFKIIEAIVLAIPVILIQLLNIFSQILVLAMILLFPIVLLVSFIPRMQELIFGTLKIMFGGIGFPAITSLLTLLIFYIEKIIETFITSGFDNIIKTLPSLLLFGLVFKLIISVVSKGVIYFLLWKYKAELIQLMLGSKARVIANDIGNHVEHGAHRTKDIVSYLPSKSLVAAQNLGNFTLAGAGFGAGVVMNSKSHFQQASSLLSSKADSEFTDEQDKNLDQKQASDIPLDKYPNNTSTIFENKNKNESEKPKQIHSFEGNIQTARNQEYGDQEQSNDTLISNTSTPFKNRKSNQEETSNPGTIPTDNNSKPIPSNNISPIQENKKMNRNKDFPNETHYNDPDTEFETLKQEWISPFKQYRIRTLEKKLEDYKEPQAMYKAQGSNAFTKAYRKTMTLDDKLKANIERRNKLTERLTQLRGG